MADVVTGLLTEILISVGVIVLGFISLATKNLSTYLKEKSNSTYDANRNEKIKEITNHLYTTIEVIAVPKVLVEYNNNHEIDSTEMKNRISEIAAEVIDIIGEDTTAYLEKHMVTDLEDYIAKILIGRLTEKVVVNNNDII